MKQIRTLKTKKAAAVAATKTKKATKQLDEATIKEVNIRNLCLIVVYRLHKRILQILLWRERLLSVVFELPIILFSFLEK